MGGRTTKLDFMSPRFIKLNAAFHQLIGRSDASRIRGDLHKAMLQLRAAHRIFQLMAK